MNDKWKVGLACFFGALIGAAIALEAHPYLWWIGILVGGLVGYIGYDVHRFLRALDAAAPQTKKDAVEARQALWFCVKLWVWFGLFVGSYLLPGWVVYVIFIGSMDDLLNPHTAPAFPVHIIFFVVNVFATIFIFWVFDKMIRDQDRVPKVDEKDEPNAVKILLIINWFALWLWWFPLALALAVCHLGRAAWAAAAVFPSIIVRAIRSAALVCRWLGSFLKHLFILVHSEARLICGCDAAIGATIGFFLGSPIAGGIIGAAAGLLNYEIVSKRLLKLVPR